MLTADNPDTVTIGAPPEPLAFAMDSLRQDLRGSLRYFRRNRGLAAAAVLVLALGIGATTAVFSVSETLLLRPLSYPDSDRLVALQSVRRLDGFPSNRAAAGTLADWRLQATSFDAVAGYRWVSLDVIDGAQSHRLSGLQVTPEFFQVFGVPLNGRAFVSGDRGAGTVVLGQDAWRRLFDADEALAGGTLDLHVRDLSRVGPTRFTMLGAAAAPLRFPPIEADFELGVAIDAVRSLPSVTGAAVVQGLPMGAGGFFGSGTIEGYVPPSGAEDPIYRLRVVSPGYLGTMRIPIVAGREFEPRDEVGERGYNRTILVSESFARRYWPGQNPLGKRIGSLVGAPEWWMTVVGVAGDVRYGGLEAAPTDDVYLPQGLYPQAAITLVARTAGDPLDEVSEVRTRIREVDEHAFVTDARSMEQVIAASQAERRAGTLLVALFGALALALVFAGVYSVIAQAVVQRRLELAIRSALGARPAHVVALAMRTALEPAAVGIVVGGLGAVVLTRAVSFALFGVGLLDVTAWAGAGVVILTACLAAGYPAARRAAGVDPMTALRAEQ